MRDDETYDQARKRAKAKFDFYVHFVIYLVVMGMLLAINLISWSGYFWVLWPGLFWGVALAFHAASAFLISQKDAMIDKMARDELQSSADHDSTG